MVKVLTPLSLTSLLPPLENWLVSWYNMVRPRFLASLKWEPPFLLRLLSSEPVTQMSVRWHETPEENIVSFASQVFMLSDLVTHETLKHNH